MRHDHLARLEALQEDMREQASGEQDGLLLEWANRLKKITDEARDDASERQRIYCPD